MAYSHRCSREQLIRQNFVPALSRCSSNIHKKPAACTSTAAIFLCIFSSLLAQKSAFIQQFQSIEQMRLPCLLYIGIISYIIIVIQNFIPYFLRSTRPLTTSIPSAIRSAACFPAPPNANSPASSPFELTTL